MLRLEELNENHRSQQTLNYTTYILEAKKQEIESEKYKVVQIWPGLIVCKQVTVCPGNIWTTLYHGFVIAVLKRYRNCKIGEWKKNTANNVQFTSLFSGKMCFNTTSLILQFKTHATAQVN
jgi:hypothetical protein